MSASNGQLSKTFAALSPEEAAARLSTSLTSGLSAAEAADRLRHGPNELPTEPPEPLWLRFAKQFQEPLIVLLLVSAAASLVVGNMDDAVSIAVAVTIVVCVGFIQEYRSEKSIEALNHLVPNHAHIVRQESSKVLAAQLVPGDLVLLATGDRVPADIRIIEASDLTIDESNLTGENEPVSITRDEGVAFMGTLVRSGHGRGLVFATGRHTNFGTIAASVTETESPKTPLQNSMAALGTQLSHASFGIIAVISLAGYLQGKSLLEIFTISISLAVAAIPEGLPIIVTVTLALGVHRMAAHHAIVRRLPSVETLGSVNVVCSDKTGTLTTNHMAVDKVWHLGELSEELDAATLRILRIGNIANNARVAQNAKSRWIGQPTDVALLDLVDQYGEVDIRDHLGPRTAETPFSSDRKWMGVTVDNVTYIKGALEKVLEQCSTCVVDDREVPLDKTCRRRIEDAATSMAADGLRVLAFASGRSTFTFAGLVGMSDPPRAGVSESIQKLMRGGVRVVMITGDSATTAVAIARKLGMVVESVMTGPEVDELDDNALIASNISVFARTNPDHKMRIVRTLQARGDIVAMTGDGVNDAPALKRADIGISMGMHGTDVAKEASDMILTDDDFSTILHAIEEGKGIFNNIQNFLTFQLSTSAAALSLVLLCTCLGYKSPLNPMQILWINIIMDGPPAQSLGVEPVDPDVMTRPPRPKGAPVLTYPLLQRVATAAAVIMTGTMLVYRHEMKDGAVNKRDTTMTFTCFVLFDMFNALTCRSESKSVLRGEVGLFSNTLFNWAVALSLAGQLLVIYFPWLQDIFQTEALGLLDLCKLIMLTSTVFWVDEARKWWKSASKRRLGTGYSQVV